MIDQTLAVIDDISRGVLRAWAQDAAAFADVLADQDPSWGSASFPLAGGRVVLCGAGMYVNRAIAVGFDGALSEGDWRTFEERCDAVGVVPAFEVSPATAAAVRVQLVARGYEIESSRAALFCSLDVVDSLPAPNPEFVIEPASGDLLPLWQTTSAAGWGHETSAARKASDAFARAAAVVDGDNLVVVRDSHDRASGWMREHDRQRSNRDAWRNVHTPGRAPTRGASGAHRPPVADGRRARLRTGHQLGGAGEQLGAEPRPPWLRATVPCRDLRPPANRNSDRVAVVPELADAALASPDSGQKQPDAGVTVMRWSSLLKNFVRSAA